ncbi:S-adenosyl-L-methionine-dependent methyltransferase [Exidia glandulosa HHB12029]|uniref:S-adenosyl-L-methionine-dependent methyltransferase n=1 Tax=Exidia glandulosa HHB12029 TaxID=1314781 RepID=A0A166BB09_EXIGL|nr:S-adenosyl-L-methionine-dependent methyltransferase [Exidia glandulosa HHB12029]
MAHTAHDDHIHTHNFNSQAHTYNERHAIGIQMLTEQLRARVDSIGFPANKTARLLDYACGTGVVSHALAPFVGSIVGIDISENMLSEYAKRAEQEDVEMRGYHGNLTGDDEAPATFASDLFFNFDIVAVGLGFHHFHNPTLAAQRLATRLKTGGKLLIIDNVSEDNGFSHESAEKLFKDAGVAQDFVFSVVDQELQIGRGPTPMMQRVFIAWGSKA